jgi:hypothetical protein
VRSILPLRAKIIAGAGALLLLPLSAIAGPADWQEVTKAIRAGYKGTVKVIVKSEDSKPDANGSPVVTAFWLQSVKGKIEPLKIEVKDGKVSELGVKYAAIFLQNHNLTSPATDKQTVALARLGALATPVDQDSKQQFYQAAGVTEEPMDNADTALFTVTGDQVSSTIASGSNSLSAGEFEDLARETTVALADINNNNNNVSAWKSATASAKPVIQSIISVQRATNKKQTKTPSDPANDKSPPLITEGQAKTIEPEQIEATLSKIYAGINAKISEKSGLLGRADSLLVQDIVKVFKEAGVSDVDVSISNRLFGRSALVLSLGAGSEREVLASNIKVSTAKGGGVYLKGDAIDELKDQIGANFSAASSAALSRTRGEPPPDDTRAESQVSEDLRWAETEETTEPPPDHTRDPTKGSTDGPGKKR